MVIQRPHSRGKSVVKLEVKKQTSLQSAVSVILCSTGTKIYVRKNSHTASFAKKQNVKHNMEKLCEKQKQHRLSMISLLRPVEEIL